MEISLGTDKPPASAAHSAPRKPGRPKGSTNAATQSRTTDQNVRQAMASLDSLYSFTAMGLTMFGLTKTAADWIEQAEGLRQTNEEALRSAPKLAAYIANAGSVGGGVTFVVAHAMALATLTGNARAELREKRQSVDNVTEIRPGTEGAFPL